MNLILMLLVLSECSMTYDGQSDSLRTCRKQKGGLVKLLKFRLTPLGLV